MAFPVEPDMTAEQFSENIIKPYFPQLLSGRIEYKLNSVDKVEENEKWIKLGKAYASIGAFLTHRGQVRKAWESLELAIRTDLGVASNGSDVIEKMKNSKKALTRALQKFETEQGFNNPDKFQFDVREQIVADEASGTKVQTVGGKPGLPLPTQAPIVTNQNLDGRDFNKILLGHGYQFKDVGAGAAHGEFSHRLQWYAIGNAAESQVDLQGLSLLEIFRSMGDWKWPKSWQALGGSGGLHLYIWESLFDNFKTDSGARAQNTIAWSANTFCCPEIVNDALSSTIGLLGNEHKVDSLYCLRTIVKRRRDKRSEESFSLDTYQEKKLAQLKAASLGSASAGTNAAALLLWKGR